MRRRAAVIGGAAAVVVLATVGVSAARAGGGVTVRQEVLQVTGTPEPDGSAVRLDATLFLPDSGRPEPAVLLAHGFGGSKADLAADALKLAEHGFVVLTYTARGFGASGGRIHLDSPDFEVADARRTVDLLGRRSEVLRDGPDDPRVGVVGGSYGGALALLLAGSDSRVDAIVPQITWNDLRQALFPQFAVAAGTAPSPAAVTPTGGPGVFKRAWAGTFFSPPADGSAGPAGTASAGAAPAGSGCGRFAAQLCAAYQQAAVTGRPTSRILDLLWASSPARVLNRIHAPALLIQGEADSLFPLSEADANARGIAAHGTPVKVVWYAGGHDGGLPETARVQSLTLDWLGRYLRRNGSPVDTRFEVSEPTAALADSGDAPVVRVRTAPGEPGITVAGPAEAVRFRLVGPAQIAAAPAGGVPAAVTALPGLGSVLGGLAGSAVAGSLGASALSALPGQVARFATAPLPEAVRIIGAPRVTLHVTSSAPDATLFAELIDVGPEGGTALPESLVSPVYLSGLPAGGRDVTVSLPAIVLDVPAGHRLEVVVSSTDQAYALPVQPRQYLIAPAGTATLSVPVIATVEVGALGLTRLLPWLLGLVGAVVLGLAAVAVVTRRRREPRPEPDQERIPLGLNGLGKAYGDGFRAVSDLSFQVEPGWVLGLLGPNGAGKTTTLRMAMGLIRPTEGEIRIFGHRVTPGAAVLSRVGSFVEGPGFLPHLSGLENLQLFWRSTGRPAAAAYLDEALEVAGLGQDVHRRVKTYSQGMRQRLAIAQAMLGMPDLLLLDEPTNGLDPPQISEMRAVLDGYAATGRTVVVSSHQLAEVEQTCTHVVVMHQGRLVAQGPVAELVGAATALVVDVDDPVRAAAVAGGVPGARDVEVTAQGLVLRLVGTPRAALVRALVEAGIQVDRVAPRRGLEEAFLALVGEEA